MKKDKNLVIINNESISKNEKGFYCDNIDMKSIPEGLSKYFNVSLIARKSSIERSHFIDIEKIETSSNLFTFLYNIFKTFKLKNTNYLIISITPYTFFSYLLLFIFRKKIFLYLRSSGYEEWKAIIGYIGPLIYHILFTIVTFGSNIIACQKRLIKNKKYDLVLPSELDDKWLQNISKPLLDKPRLLYVGRMKVEKGIFSLFKIFNKIDSDIDLSIVGKIEKQKPENKRINFIGHGYDAQKIIKIYDNHNISILPSFTEAHPKVLDESLARSRPVIIFEEISHIIQDRQGIFIAKRNVKSLLETVEFIIKNYSSIQDKMNKNNLPTKQKFISQMVNIIN